MLTLHASRSTRWLLLLVSLLTAFGPSVTAVACCCHHSHDHDSDSERITGGDIAESLGSEPALGLRWEKNTDADCHRCCHAHDPAPATPPNLIEDGVSIPAAPEACRCHDTPVPLKGESETPAEPELRSAQPASFHQPLADLPVPSGIGPDIRKGPHGTHGGADLSIRLCRWLN